MGYSTLCYFLFPLLGIFLLVAGSADGASQRRPSAYHKGVKRVRRGKRDSWLHVPDAIGRVKKWQKVIANDNDYATQVLAA